MSGRYRAGSITKFIPLHEQHSQHIHNTAQEEHLRLKKDLLEYIQTHMPQEILSQTLSPELRVIRCANFFTDSLTRLGFEVFEPSKEEPRNVVAHLYLYYVFTSLVCEQLNEKVHEEILLRPQSPEEVAKIVPAFFSLFFLVIEGKNLFLRSKQQ